MQQYRMSGEMNYIILVQITGFLGENDVQIGFDDM